MKDVHLYSYVTKLQPLHCKLQVVFLNFHKNNVTQIMNEIQSYATVKSAQQLNTTTNATKYVRNSFQLLNSPSVCYD